MPDEPAIKIGDLVRLKSGSPVMTVDRSEGAWYLRCVWYEENAGKIRDGVFHSSALKVVQVVQTMAAAGNVEVVCPRCNGEKKTVKVGWDDNVASCGLCSGRGSLIAKGTNS